jgi:hypothetical protein
VNDNQSSLHNMQVRLASMEDEIEKWKLLLGVGGWQLDRRFSQQQDKIDALETRVIRRLEMVEAAVFSAPAPELEKANKAIPMADWNEALNELRDGIVSKDFEVAAACMKVALRLLNPCPF